jgi:hypothetical protein
MSQISFQTKASQNPSLQHSAQAISEECHFYKVAENSSQQQFEGNMTRKYLRDVTDILGLGQRHIYT